MFFGMLAALASGGAFPYFIVYFGKVLDGLNEESDIRDTVAGFCLVFVVVGLLSSVFGFTFVLCWTMAGERQALLSSFHHLFRHCFS